MNFTLEVNYLFVTLQRKGGYRYPTQGCLRAQTWTWTLSFSAMSANLIGFLVVTYWCLKKVCTGIDWPVIGGGRELKKCVRMVAGPMYWCIRTQTLSVLAGMGWLISLHNFFFLYNELWVWPNAPNDHIWALIKGINKYICNVYISLSSWC